jgi:BlaI family transcriptional regulator, penicillinase repressor
MKKLTQAEEEVMQKIWILERALVKDVLNKFTEPRPNYNTVATVLKVLEKKGFVSHKAYGTTYEYFPIISKDEYAKLHFSEFVRDYFNNSFPKMAAFFAGSNNLSLKEMEEILKLTENELKKTIENHE